jgi:hypothetical protein
MYLVYDCVPCYVTIDVMQDTCMLYLPLKDILGCALPLYTACLHFAATTIIGIKYDHGHIACVMDGAKLCGIDVWGLYTSNEIFGEVF